MIGWRGRCSMRWTTFVKHSKNLKHFSGSTNENTLYGGQSLGLGEGLSNGPASFKLEINGDLRILHNAHNFYRTKTAFSGAVVASMQEDGNFVLYNSNRKSIWSTSTDGNRGSKLVLESNCTLSVVNSQGKPIYNFSNYNCWKGKSFGRHICPLFYRFFASKHVMGFCGTLVGLIQTSSKSTKKWPHLANNYNSL